MSKLSTPESVLSSGTCDEVVAAAVELQRGGSHRSAEELARLRQCLDDAPERDRLPIAETYLELLTGEERVRAVVEFTRSGNPAEREAALVASRHLDDSAVPELAALTDAETIELRWSAYQAIKHVGGEAAIDPLVKGLQDAEPSIRWIASDGLTAIGEPAIAPLLRALAISGPAIAFHRAARRVLNAVELPRHESALNELVASLGGMSTVVQSPALAQQLLRTLEADVE